MLRRLKPDANQVLHRGEYYGPGDTLDLTAKEAAQIARLLEPVAAEPESDPEPPEKLSLSTATAKQLEALKHVGPSTAQKLIDAQPFESLEEAQQASSLNDSQWAEIVDRVEV